MRALIQAGGDDPSWKVSVCRLLLSLKVDDFNGQKQSSVGKAGRGEDRGLSLCAGHTSGMPLGPSSQNKLQSGKIGMRKGGTLERSQGLEQAKLGGLNGKDEK